MYTCARVKNIMELRRMGVELAMTDKGALVAHLTVRPLLITRIRELQAEDAFLDNKKKEV